MVTIFFCVARIVSGTSNYVRSFKVITFTPLANMILIGIVVNLSEAFTAYDDASSVYRK